MVEGNKIDKKEAKFRIKNGDKRNQDFFDRPGGDNTSLQQNGQQRKILTQNGSTISSNYQSSQVPQIAGGTIPAFNNINSNGTSSYHQYKSPQNHNKYGKQNSTLKNFQKNNKNRYQQLLHIIHKDQ